MVALPVPALEVRVPPEWQSQMSARALSQNEPATPRNLQLTCSRVVERMVETNSTLSVPAFVWEFVCSEHAGHPQRVGMLASITSGVEKEWKAHVVVRLLGELCGMLEHDLSPHVNRRILALLRGGLGCGIPHEAIAALLRGENAVPLGDAVASLPQLSLSAGRQATLETALRQLGEPGVAGGVPLPDMVLLAMGSLREQAAERGDATEEDDEAAAAGAAAALEVEPQAVGEAAAEEPAAEDALTPRTAATSAAATATELAAREARDAAAATEEAPLVVEDTDVAARRAAPAAEAVSALQGPAEGHGAGQELLDPVPEVRGLFASARPASPLAATPRSAARPCGKSPGLALLTLHSRRAGHRTFDVWGDRSVGPLNCRNVTVAARLLRCVRAGGFGRRRRASCRRRRQPFADRPGNDGRRRAAPRVRADLRRV